MISQKVQSRVDFSKAWIQSLEEGQKYNLFSDHMNSNIFVIVLKGYYAIFAR